MLLVENCISIQFSNDLEELGCVKHFWLGNCEDVSTILNPEQVINGRSVLKGSSKFENSTDIDK